MLSMRQLRMDLEERAKLQKEPEHHNIHSIPVSPANPSTAQSQADGVASDVFIFPSATLPAAAPLTGGTRSRASTALPPPAPSIRQSTQGTHAAQGQSTVRTLHMSFAAVAAEKLQESPRACLPSQRTPSRQSSRCGSPNRAPTAANLSTPKRGSPRRGSSVTPVPRTPGTGTPRPDAGRSARQHAEPASVLRSSSADLRVLSPSRGVANYNIGIVRGTVVGTSMPYHREKDGESSAHSPTLRWTSPEETSSPVMRSSSSRGQLPWKETMSAGTTVAVATCGSPRHQSQTRKSSPVVKAQVSKTTGPSGISGRHCFRSSASSPRKPWLGGS